MNVLLQMNELKTTLRSDSKRSGAKRSGIKLLVITTLLLTALGLSACGFQLRGTETRIATNASVFVDASGESTIREELRKLLSDRSFKVVDSRDDANVLLRLADENQSQRIVSVQSSGRVSEFELAHSVNLQIAQSTDETLPVYADDQQTNRVEVIREYTFDQNVVLAKEDEAAILREEMRKELALQIVLRTVATIASPVK